MKKLREKIIVALVILLAALLLFQVVVIEAVTPKGLPLNVTVRAEGLIDQSATGQRVVLVLPRWNNALTYSSPYRQTQNETIPFWIPVLWRRTTMVVGVFTYENVIFTDPYNETSLLPLIMLKGETVDGDPYEGNGTAETPFPYGTYHARYRTQYFENRQNIVLEPHQGHLRLMPNDQTVVIEETEARRIANYVRDYLELSAQGMIPDAGFPKQYHLFVRNATLSLGDILFVLCQLSKPSHPVLFFPKDSVYVSGGEKDCYQSMLAGEVPAAINGERAEQAVYEQLSDIVRTIPFSFGDLNQKRHVRDWALSFDIEYGRYVPEEGVSSQSESTCAIAPEYLAPEQCRDPDFAGWVTNSTGTWWFGEYGYPLGSGLVGWRQILELSHFYGIPTTQYFVVKDARLFGKTDPELFLLSKQLAKHQLIEIGSHTRYHTRLDKVSEEVAREELLASRNELEKVFDVRVQGFRPPYLSLVNSSIGATERMLAETGYAYYSVYGAPRTSVYDGKTIAHKPVNFYGYLAYAPPELLDVALRELPYVVSLDHPWNMLFRETGSPIVLEEAPRQPVQMKAIILTAMSRGVHFTTVEKIAIR
jgi:peptidoglycan/xylan/chitin deacetylase (PgdA/CDA1 family)